MQLTTRNTENLVRTMASAGREELESCARDLTAMTRDDGQPWACVESAKGLLRIVRARIKGLK